MINTRYTDNEALKRAHLDFPDNMPNGYEKYPILYGKFFKILLSIPKNSYVLDIGCNSGEISRLLRDFNGCKTQGIDISKKVVKIAQNKGLNVVLGDNEKLPFPDNEFDCVFMGEMIEHSHEPEKILKEVYRVLKPGGKLFGTTVEEESCPQRWDNGRLHAKSYSCQTMKVLISKIFYKVKTDILPLVDMPTIIFEGYKK